MYVCTYVYLCTYKGFKGQETLYTIYILCMGLRGSSTVIFILYSIAVYDTGIKYWVFNGYNYLLYVVCAEIW